MKGERNRYINSARNCIREGRRSHYKIKVLGAGDENVQRFDNTEVSENIGMGWRPDNLFALDRSFKRIARCAKTRTIKQEMLDIFDGIA